MNRTEDFRRTDQAISAHLVVISFANRQPRVDQVVCRGTGDQGIGSGRPCLAINLITACASHTRPGNLGCFGSAGDRCQAGWRRRNRRCREDWRNLCRRPSHQPSDRHAPCSSMFFRSTSHRRSRSFRLAMPPGRRYRLTRACATPHIPRHRSMLTTIASTVVGQGSNFEAGGDLNPTCVQRDVTSDLICGKVPLVDQARLLEPAKERITCLSWIGRLADQGVVLGVDRCDRTAALAVIGYLVGEFQPFFNDWIDELCIADMVHDSIAQRETRVGRHFAERPQTDAAVVEIDTTESQTTKCRDPVGNRRIIQVDPTCRLFSRIQHATHRNCSWLGRLHDR